MTSIFEFVGGDYLKSEDLNGGERTLRLAGFGFEEIKSDDGKEKKAVAAFAEVSKKLVIGAKANVRVLLQMFGTDQVEEWDTKVKQSPHFVTLFTEETNFGPGLRIRPAQQPVPTMQPQQQPVQHPMLTPGATSQQTITPEQWMQFQQFQQMQNGQG